MRRALGTPKVSPKWKKVVLVAAGVFVVLLLLPIDPKKVEDVLGITPFPSWTSQPPPPAPTPVPTAKPLPERPMVALKPCLPTEADTFEDFLVELKSALEGQPLPLRPIYYVFRDAPPHYVSCQGEWLEFGVASGGTINHAARWRTKFCGKDSLPVHGFDTFTGLPEKWEHDSKGSLTFEQGAFDQHGNFPPVEPNVRLHKGLFNDTLPVWLHASHAAAEEAMLDGTPGMEGAVPGDVLAMVGVSLRRALRAAGGAHPARHARMPAHIRQRRAAARRLRRSGRTLTAEPRPDCQPGTSSDRAVHHPRHTRRRCRAPLTPDGWAKFPGAVSYIHIDCDLYAGTIQALTLLSDRIHPGTVIIFDELINYNNYRAHEVKALWEWLNASGRHLRPIGIVNWPEEQQGVDINPPFTYPPDRQSAAFVVA